MTLERRHFSNPEYAQHRADILARGLREITRKTESPDWKQEPLEALKRPVLAHYYFSDVYPEQRSANGTPFDFDAEITSDWHSLDIRPPLRGKYGIGSNPTLGAYGIELISNLVDQAIVDIKREEQRGGELTQKVRRARRYLKVGAVCVVGNIAPRSAETAANNGTDFHLALLDNGVEIYAVPLDLLKYVKHKVVALWKIPNEGHPVFDGEMEQFRSSLIVRSREYPDHLKRIMNPEEIIPEQQNDLEVAFTDEFGNMRLSQRLKSPPILGDNRRCSLIIGGHRINDVHLDCPCLNEIPGEECGLYRNPDDVDDRYLELAVKGQGAWFLLGKPPLGTPVSIIEEERRINERA
jgi:hypothetical protein